MTFLQDFSSRLRITRRRRKLTQQALAELVGVTTSSIGMYETARRMPGLDVVSALASALDISLDELIPGPGSPIR